MENNLEIFIVGGEVDKISCHSNNPNTNKIIEKLNSSEKKVFLSDIKEEIISGPMGFQLHTSDYVSIDYPKRVWLIQILNLDKNGELLKTKYDKFISKEKDLELKKSRVKKGDIIIAKTGSIDRCVFIKEDINANLNQALGIIRLRKEYNGIKIIPEYIHEFLNSSYGMSQLMRLGGYRAAQSGLSLDEIGSIILILPEENEQIKIINKIHELRNSAMGSLAEYKRCLYKIETLLGEHLHINKKDFPNNFLLKSSEIGDRLDYYFYSPELKYIQSKIKDLDNSKFQIVTGEDLSIITQMREEEIENKKLHVFKYVDIGNTEKDLGEIINYEEDIPINLPTRARQLVKGGDILIPKQAGFTKGVVLVPAEFDNNLFSTGFMQIRPNSLNESFLLWVILRSELIQKQLFYIQSGTVLPDINLENFKEHLYIPIPKGETKNKILSEARDLIKKAKNHKDEYNLKLQKAQDKFIEILGL